MISVFAPLVEDVEDVDAVDPPDVEPGIPRQIPPGSETTVQEPDPEEDELEEDELEEELDDEELLDDVPGSTASARPFTTSDTGLEPVPVEELLVPGSSVFTWAVATPCQTIPTSIIPAATAARRLTVLRRPGLISTLFPSS
ncbi:hypothetical protein [Actinomycetospora termitidis]|uniref:Uncharacterized protein n=1 Tax=Actinomycetospora termitidis TaxID=3053470 RepID=A0ABT7MHP3_9PSEU|nr:hypothetical protein [Actinomycetospora sp. Odt1-22]MDL5160206.1 hypothetical protein [Actinomycetospora sp. Odt1-22]